MIRHTFGNWARYSTHNKQTTTRTHEIKPGAHKCYGGARFKPVLLGYLHIGKAATKLVRDLTEEDAKLDGFCKVQVFRGDTWYFADEMAFKEYLLELAHLNPDLTLDTTVYIHPARVITEQEYISLTSHVPKEIVQAIVKELGK